MVVMAVGTLLYAPAYFLDPDTPNWTVPAIILISMGPFLACCLYGPTVINITMHLPSPARRSKDSLIAFATKVPPSTRLNLKFIRFAPWPLHRQISYSDLHRLPTSWFRISNLEHLPFGKEEAYRSGMWAWAVKTWFGRYWVNMASAQRDRSHVPGVWNQVWKGIPFVDSVEAKKVEAARSRSVERTPVGTRTRGVVQARDVKLSQPVRGGEVGGAKRRP
ncbi:hypothetical protein LTR62_006133 [Meristemomyces frigidus]|uniref:Uncharacterized protein n=1 Tax=Meristemomyces frigidus TaxID=1508187 RepID=A0AAN7TCU1_9PEZI|nr:hypothetical protein LTR62_006133 [Meristemomyces frigidus]